ncbi:hypothetical protein PP175_01440 [Aneurinibacillus sp. Ricciae_BoGa-3]|nr:hypothetical protein [Aneurinibacillus sp. Ricciae_BoGa-3]WCK54731.1 hypothetical protein PP175_01440 [Aneurinibacillus sp. Ricciae_BoGa-3]
MTFDLIVNFERGRRTFVEVNAKDSKEAFQKAYELHPTAKSVGFYIGRFI